MMGSLSVPESIDSPHREARAAGMLFLAFALAGGLSFLFVTPPLGSPDEEVHLARALLISEGQWWAPGEAPWARAEIPRSLVRLLHVMRHAPPNAPPRTFEASELRSLVADPLDPEITVPARYLGYYPPLAYLPQAAALWLARRVAPSPIVLVYAGRLGNLLAYTAMGWLAIALTPLRRWSLCLLLLTPMSVAQAASLSADAPTLSIAALFFSLTCRIGFGTKPLGRNSHVGLLLAAGGLGLVKPGYWILSCAPLLTPPARFPDPAARRFVLAGCLLAAVLPSALWMAIVAASQPFSASPVADAPAQLSYVIAHPLDFAGILLRTIASGIPMYVETFVGRLGHLNIPLPTWLWIAFPGALIASALADRPDPPELDAWRRSALVALFALGAVGILLLAHLGWNAVGAHRIQGVQGRYFTPLAPLLLLAFPARGGRLSDAVRARLVGTAAFVGLATSLSALWQGFFGSR